MERMTSSQSDESVSFKPGKNRSSVEMDPFITFIEPRRRVFTYEKGLFCKKERPHILP